MKFTPVAETVDGQELLQYRGIPYGTITKRFTEPNAVVYDDNSAAKLDCTKFGPICPQVQTDFHHLLRIPDAVKSQEPTQQYDEFNCLNLDITTPVSHAQNLPVLIWIHGGSQVMTFLPASSPSGDVRPFVAQSIAQKQPMIVVFVNYRLNIFAFGDGKGSKNLALKDQRLAIEWVSKNINCFGGDPSNITLAGESAGAVYVHAHMLLNVPVRRAILQSGSLYLSSPQPLARGDAMCASLDTILSNSGHTLASAPVDILVDAVREAKIVSMWLQATDEFSGWETRISHVEQLLVGDVEYESVIWRNGIESATAESIVACFDADAEYAASLKQIYNIVPSRPTSCKLGALDYINDVCFALPVTIMRDAYRRAGKVVYDYVLDQVNPWQASSRAHHAVDLLMLFGALNFEGNKGAVAVKQVAREKWIAFVNGSEPWSQKKTFAFGPLGKCDELEQDEYEDRRRVAAFKVLNQMGQARYKQIFGSLAAGRISLLN